MKIDVFKILIIFFLFFFIFSLRLTIEAACLDKKPIDRPDLFQIDYQNGSATLYFTPVKDQITGYNIIYGRKLHQEDFGITFKNDNKKGVVLYTINYLSPNTTYYFRVRPVNNCRFGLFSETMKIETKKNKVFYKYDNNNKTSEQPKNKNIPVPTLNTTVYPENNFIKKYNYQPKKEIVKKERFSLRDYWEFFLLFLKGESK